MGVFKFTNLAWGAGGDRFQAFKTRQSLVDPCEFKARLIKRASFRTTMATQETCLEKQKQTSQQIHCLLALSAGCERIACSSTEFSLLCYLYINQWDGKMA